MRAGSGVQKFEPCSGAQGADSCTHSSFSHLTNNRPASTVADSYLPDGDLPRSRGKGSAPVPVTSVFSSKHPASCPLGALVPVRLPRGGCPPVPRLLPLLDLTWGFPWGGSGRHALPPPLDPGWPPPPWSSVRGSGRAAFQIQVALQLLTSCPKGAHPGPCPRPLTFHLTWDLEAPTQAQ